MRIIGERPSILQLLILIKLIAFKWRTLDSLYFYSNFLRFLKMFQVQIKWFWVHFSVFNICALNTLELPMVNQVHGFGVWLGVWLSVCSWLSVPHGHWKHIKKNKSAKLRICKKHVYNNIAFMLQWLSYKMVCVCVSI